MKCNLCPRKCNIDRTETIGYCASSYTMKIARAALHMWEEPCISGREGSGAIFFSGCNLRCIFCQNYGISCGERGHEVSAEELAEEMLKLESAGANNINLVTAGHYLPEIIKTIRLAKDMGLKIPIVYNTSGYESVEAIKVLEGLVDIYLPDHKYFSDELAMKFSNAPDYHEVATKALDEMVRQCDERMTADDTRKRDTYVTVNADDVKTYEFDKRGIMKRGVIVRHLCLPGHTKDSMKVLEFLHERYGEKIYISIMNQYTPMKQVLENARYPELAKKSAGMVRPRYPESMESAKYPELVRKVTKREYEKVLNYATLIGIENGFIQEGDTAKESFIPEFE